MSARAPFFPTGAASSNNNTAPRPPTRNSIDRDKPGCQPPNPSSTLNAGGDSGLNASIGGPAQLSTTSFHPDPSNPPHSYTGHGQKQPGLNAVVKAPTTANGASSANADSPMKLNTGGLGNVVKKKRQSGAGVAPGPLAGGGMSFGSASDAHEAVAASRIARPGTADPHRAQARQQSGRQQQNSGNAFGSKNATTTAFGRRDSVGPKLIAPVPIPANMNQTSPLLADGGGNYDTGAGNLQFKMPSLHGRNAGSTTTRSISELQYDFSSDRTHISGEIAQERSEKRQQQAFRTPFAPGSGHRASDTSGSSSATLAGHDDHDDLFDGDEDGTNTSGVLRSKELFSGFNGYEQRDVGPRRVSIIDIDPESGFLPRAGHGMGLQSVSNSGDRQHAGKKRSRDRAEDDGPGNEYDQHPAPKRLKVAKGPGDRRSGSREHDSIYGAGGAQGAVGLTAGHRSNEEVHRSQSQDVVVTAAAVVDRGRSYSVDTNEVDRVLKVEMEGFVKENMHVYDRGVERWNECSLEDWMNGPEELTAKFSELLNLVRVFNLTKDRMTKQLKFYADMQLKLSNYSETLEDRQRMLDTAKEKVIDESNYFLG